MQRKHQRVHQRKNSAEGWRSRSVAPLLRILPGLLTMLLAFLLPLPWAGSMERAYAAQGRLSIALSDTEIAVGDEVTVTLSAVGPGGGAASADMAFTYSSGIFSFVSCNADNYSGGEGGSVSFYGSRVKVVLRAVAEGRGSFQVTGSDGVDRGNGNALDGMEAAGVAVYTGAAGKSGDNSLASLSLSVGELTPEFSYLDTEYTATVPNEVTEVQVQAAASHGKAQIASIEGNTGLQVGENVIRVTVKAENGEEAVYAIKLTREEAPAVAAPPEGSQNPAEQGTEPEDPGQAQEEIIKEYEKRLDSLNEQYTQLQNKYRSDKAFYRFVISALIVVIAALMFTCANILLFRRGKKKGAEWPDGEAQEGQPEWPDGEAQEGQPEQPVSDGSTEQPSGGKRPEPLKDEELQAEPQKPKEKKKKDHGRRRRPRRRKDVSGAWLGEDAPEEIETMVFSHDAIPVPKKEGASQENVDFIDLDQM